MIVTKKLKLIVDEEDTDKRNMIYSYIKEEQYQQYKALNLGITLLFVHNQLQNIGSGAEKKLENQISKLVTNIKKNTSELEKIKDSKKRERLTKTIESYQDTLLNLRKDLSNCEKNRILEDISFKEKYIDDLYTVLQSQVSFKNKDNMSLVTQKLKADFKTSLVNGLARGERNLSNYKRNTALMTRGRDLVLSKVKDSFYIDWIRGIKFKVFIGRNDKDKDELIYTLNNVLDFQSEDSFIDKIVNGKPELDEKGKVKRIKNPRKDYKICDSSFKFVDNKLILNLALDINNNISNEFVSNRVVGVDLGIKIPALVTLNDKYYVKKSIGSFESFMKVNAQMKSRRSRLQKQINKSQSGKGRKHKLQSLDNLKEKRSNYNTTYNHYLSKEIVKFALDNKAGQINMEFLTSETFKKNKLLADWSYYQLQQFVEYKAKKHGITVKYIDPYLTSQTCSICGHYEEGQRESQSIFECKSCKKQLNADYNAEQNIAKSIKYVEKIEDTQYYKLKRQGKFNDITE